MESDYLLIGPAIRGSGLYKKHIDKPSKTKRLHQGQIDFKKLKSALEPYILTLLQRLLPNGKVQGNEFVALNPRRGDKKLGSFSINIHTGKWSDFATGDRGGDTISLWAYIQGLNQIEAAKELQAIIGGVNE